jgi:hypothetical protein
MNKIDDNKCEAPPDENINFKKYASNKEYKAMKEAKRLAKPLLKDVTKISIIKSNSSNRKASHDSEAKDDIEDSNNDSPSSDNSENHKVGKRSFGTPESGDIIRDASMDYEEVEIPVMGDDGFQTVNTDQKKGKSKRRRKKNAHKDKAILPIDNYENGYIYSDVYKGKTSFKFSLLLHKFY